MEGQLAAHERHPEPSVRIVIVTGPRLQEFFPMTDNLRKMNLNHEQTVLERKIVFCKRIAWIFVSMGFLAIVLGFVALPYQRPFELKNLDQLGSFYQGTVASFWSLAALFFHIRSIFRSKT